MSHQNQFYTELNSLISRWGKESDITVFEIIGAMEATKADLLDDLKQHNEKDD